MRNVHEFDGKLRKIVVPSVPKEDEALLISKFSERSMRPPARGIANDILYYGDDVRNMDHANDMNARNLLVVVLYLISGLPENDHLEWYSLLEEQLVDMARLGPCPQGRTVRLWQLLLCLLDEKSPTPEAS